MIKAQGLRKSYNHREVLKGITIEARKGEVVGLLGPNGAGKTTTFKLILGEIRGNSGKIFLRGNDISDLPMWKRVKMGIGYLPQEVTVFRGLTVEDNIISYLEFTGLSKKKILARAKEMLEEMGLAHLRYRKAYLLSGGERRRLEIARALSLSPDFLLLDEPFTGIDPIAVKEMRHLIAGLKKKGAGIIITDHNVKETLKITDKAYIISNGKILKSGRPKELSNDFEVRKIYLGKDFRIEDETEAKS